MYASATVVLGWHVHPGKHGGVPFPQNWIDGVRPWDGIFWLLLAAIIWLALHVLREKLSLGNAGTKHLRISGRTGGYRSFLTNHWKYPALSFLLIMFGWGLVLLLLWPGASMNDQIGIIDAPLAYSSVHPAVYSFLLSWFATTSNELFGSGNPGFAAFVAIQMTFCAAIVSLVAAWLAYRGCGRVVCDAVVAFFALCPVVSDYAVIPLKDTTFSYALLLLVPILYEVAEQGERFWEGWRKPACLVVACLLVGVTRNNGPYVVIPLVLGVGIACVRMPHVRIRLATLVVAVVLCLAPNKIADSILGI